MGLKYNFKHGLTNNKDRCYRMWLSIRSRCYCKSDSSYHRYGGRGITICKSWQDHLNFRKWYFKNKNCNENIQIDRINNDGNYTPKNCRLTTAKKNCNNRGTCRFVIVNGEKFTLTEISEKYNIPYMRIMTRLWRGWEVEEAIFTPPRKKLTPRKTSKVRSDRK